MVTKTLVLMIDGEDVTFLSEAYHDECMKSHSLRRSNEACKERDNRIDNLLREHKMYENEIRELKIKLRLAEEKNAPVGSIVLVTQTQVVSTVLESYLELRLADPQDKQGRPGLAVAPGRLIRIIVE